MTVDLDLLKDRLCRGAIQNRGDPATSREATSVSWLRYYEPVCTQSHQQSSGCLRAASCRRWYAFSSQILDGAPLSSPSLFPFSQKSLELYSFGEAGSFPHACLTSMPSNCTEEAEASPYSGPLTCHMNTCLSIIA